MSSTRKRRARYAVQHYGTTTLFVTLEIGTVCVPHLVLLAKRAR